MSADPDGLGREAACPQIFEEGPCIEALGETFSCLNIPADNRLATTDGPSDGISCPSDSMQADIWFRYAAPCTGRMFLNMDDYLLQSALDPQQKIVMNYTGAMPTVKGQLSVEKIRSIIEFMKNLDKFDSKGKLLPEFQRPE